MRAPNTFIVGAPKCGTTSLWELLRQHPDVQFAPVKEPNHFNSDMQMRRGVRAPTYRDPDLYNALFENLNAPRRGEASVWYLYSQIAIPRIVQRYPDARFVVCLRPPADAVRSMHAYSLKLGGEDLPRLRDAWNAETQRRNQKRIPKGVHIVQSLYYRDIYRFAEQLERAQQHVAPEQLHCVLLEDLKQHPRETTQRVFDFLQVDSKFEPRPVVANSTRSHRKRPFAHLSRRLPRLRRWVVQNTSPALRLRIEGALARTLKQRTPSQQIDASILSEIQTHFAPEVVRLSEFLKRDLTHWNAP